MMAEEKEAFYVVKKGDVVGIYKNFTHVKSLLSSSSVAGESISVHKGYSLPKKSEEYLVSHGLKGACYSLGVSSVPEGLFGRLQACPYQHPPTEGRALDVNSYPMRLQEEVQASARSSPFTTNPRPLITNVPLSEPSTCVARSSSFSTNSGSPIINVPESELSTRKVSAPSSSSFSTLSPRPLIMKKVAGSSSSFSTNSLRPATIYNFQPEASTCLSCILHFDGASKGNPGPAGAGAVLRAEDNSKVYRFREGVGHQTNNVAEYRALILGLKQAIKKGYKHIRAEGDSMLVCYQVQGKWKIKNQNMLVLCNEAKELKNKFLSFQINHVLREYNSEADAQANLAINLKDGQVEEDLVSR